MLCVTGFTQYGSIVGYIEDRRTNEGILGASIYINSNQQGVASDVNGNFEIDSLKPGIYNLTASYFGMEDSVIKGVEIIENRQTEIKLILPPPCKYDARAKNKRCPKCNKKNKVIPIVYGLIIGIDKKYQKRHYLGGCVISGCDPNWYCKRNQLKF